MTYQAECEEKNKELIATIKEDLDEKKFKVVTSFTEAEEYKDFNGKPKKTNRIKLWVEKIPRNPDGSQVFVINVNSHTVTLGTRPYMKHADYNKVIEIIKNSMKKKDAAKYIGSFMMEMSQRPAKTLSEHNKGGVLYKSALNRYGAVATEQKTAKNAAKGGRTRKIKAKSKSRTRK